MVVRFAGGMKARECGWDRKRAAVSGRNCLVTPIHKLNKLLAVSRHPDPPGAGTCTVLLECPAGRWARYAAKG